MLLNNYDSNGNHETQIPPSKFILILVVSIIVLLFMSKSNYTTRGKMNQKVDSLNAEVTNLKATLDSLKKARHE